MYFNFTKNTLNICQLPADFAVGLVICYAVTNFICISLEVIYCFRLNGDEPVSVWELMELAVAQTTNEKSTIPHSPLLSTATLLLRNSSLVNCLGYFGNNMLHAICC